MPSAADIEAARLALGLNEFMPVLNSKGEPWNPTTLQCTALLLWHIEAMLFGGAAGPGKSEYLCIETLRDPYIRQPGYSALLMRRHRKDFYLPEGLKDRLDTWLKPGLADGRVKWDHDMHGYRFLQYGSRVVLGYADDDRALAGFAGSAYQTICIDEAVQFTRRQLGILGSRLRGFGHLATLPPRYRLASNPADPTGEGYGYLYLLETYVKSLDRKKFLYVPGRLADNPHRDPGYEDRLRKFLDPVMLARLLDGDWSAREGGGWFERVKFVVLDEPPAPEFVTDDIRYWDLAGTDEKIPGDPDFTCGLRMQKLKGYTARVANTHVELDACIRDVEHFRAEPGPVERRVEQVTKLDGKGVRVRIEQEPGQSGKAQIERFRDLLVGYDCAGDKTSGPKDVRARPFSAAVNRGRIGIVRGKWNKDYLDELEGYPGNVMHDDQVDGSSGAFNLLYVAKPGFTGWLHDEAEKARARAAAKR